MQSGKVTEKSIENAILEYLNSLPYCFAWKNNSVGIYDPRKKIYRKSKSRYHINGVSDIIGIYRGRALFLEVKTPGRIKRATENQKEFLKKTGELGAISAIVASIEDTQNVLNDYKGTEEWARLLRILWRPEFTNSDQL